jgi:hypothetical protein
VSSPPKWRDLTSFLFRNCTIASLPGPSNLATARCESRAINNNGQILGMCAPRPSRWPWCRRGARGAGPFPSSSLISGPAIIAGGLAAFALASAARQPRPGNRSRRPSRRRRRLKPGRWSGTGSSVRARPHPVLRTRRHGNRARQRREHLRCLRPGHPQPARDPLLQRGRRPDPACHLRPVLLPIQQSAHPRGGPVHPAQHNHRHPRRPRRPRLSRRDDHGGSQLHGSAPGSGLPQRGQDGLRRRRHTGVPGRRGSSTTSTTATPLQQPNSAPRSAQASQHAGSPEPPDLCTRRRQSAPDQALIAYQG